MLVNPTIIRYLQKTPIFQYVPHIHIAKIARCLEQTSMKSGTQIFKKGDVGFCLYIISKGSVAISLEPNAPQTTWLTTLEKGECFGEMSLLDEQPCSAYATAIEDCELLVLSKFAFDRLLRSSNELAIGIIRSLSMRLRQANVKQQLAAQQTGPKKSRRP